MKIAVLVSGGVDSSVALALLKEQGHEVTAFYLKIWLQDELAWLGSCPWQDDLAYVTQVCDALQVPLEIVSLQREYWDRVVSYVIDEIKVGRTPNPDIFCNKRIKFGAFFDKIDSSFDKVASGHYAQIVQHDGLYALKQSPDVIKDQTYFLAQVSQQQLARMLFPIGHLQKSEVRRLAHQYNLANKDRTDSQGICFLGPIKFSEFIKQYMGERVGDIIEIETEKKLGEHTGFWYYTIGQRQGLRLPGGPWYVVAKDTNKNYVYVSRDYYNPAKERDTFVVQQGNWLSGQKPRDKMRLGVKMRHGPHMYTATLEFMQEDQILVTLDGQDQGIASGQFAVFYDNDICLGAAVIR